MKKNYSHKNQKGIEDFVMVLGQGVFIFSKICWFGIKRAREESLEMLLRFAAIASFLAALILGEPNYLQNVIEFIWGDPLHFYFHLFFTMSPMTQYWVLLGFLTVSALAVMGFPYFRRKMAFQKAIERSGLKTALGEVPQVKSIISVGEHRSKVIVETLGVGLNKFETQRDSLTAGFRQTIESIMLHEDKGKVVIDLCECDLPKMIGFHEIYAHIKEPYSFIIGQSLKGPMVQPLRSLPHLLISGATGGGKSIFFRTTVLSLLKSSPYLQVYLLDLKRGVEVKEFEALPNVTTAKDEKEATHILQSLVEEMHRRYHFLESHGYKCIDPSRDELDLIVVGIDEAAALFGNKSNELARKHIGELARLARASGIHLVPSTQKPVKDAIDTEILDNLTGRMTFRMVSSAASNVAMGGNLAKKLPAIKGRAMWTYGSHHQEVQAPYIDDESLKQELEIIQQEFTDGLRRNFQPLLGKSRKSSITKAREKGCEKKVHESKKEIHGNEEKDVQTSRRNL